MKGSMGLLIAVFLGVLGGILNLMYLNTRGAEFEQVYFLGIKPGTTVKAGEVFADRHFVRVGVPKFNVGGLRQFAVLDEARAGVIETRASRDFRGGELVLHEDVKTAPPPKLNLQSGEAAFPVPIDTRQFVPSLIVPGETPISFVLPSEGGQPIETLGPFEVLSVGNRLGSEERMVTMKIPQRQENVVLVRARLQGANADPNAQKLINHVQRTGGRPLLVMLLPSR